MRKPLYSVLYMFLVTLVFTALVSAVSLLSDKRIRSNQMLKRQHIILQVLDILPAAGLSGVDTGEFYSTRIREVRIRDRTLYVGFESDGRTVKGYAFPVSGPGFWGPITGMAAVSKDASRILGVAFTDHSETPGLGGRITEDWFTGQFKGRPVFPISGGDKIFELAQPGSPGSPDALDAITGATNTSAAVETFLNAEFNTFLRDFWEDLKTRN